MERVHLLPGKAQCRFCGEVLAINRMSTHIAREHPRQRTDLSPTLVRKPPASDKS